ncbi:hypothetical protein [Rhodococcus qingshengii]|uniref:hypothetical protein n=1 Tax=Rhodococcus qingshengii TaxID=334542 RepID=UPI001C24D985|nr:hypothetical protein [Rhodococcus qingshengii]QXC40899.1 hypothetical protein KSE96_17305 [Rhodococcus qingshengii]
MSRIIDDIQSARDKVPLPAPGNYVDPHVKAAHKATHESADDGLYKRDSLVRAAAELIVALEILDRADEERR